MAVCVLSGIAAIDFLLSGTTFSFFTLPDLARGSFAVAGEFGTVCAASFLLLVLFIMQLAYGDLSMLTLLVVRRILAWPAELADTLLPIPSIRIHH